MPMRLLSYVYPCIIDQKITTSHSSLKRKVHYEQAPNRGRSGNGDSSTYQIATRCEGVMKEIIVQVGVERGLEIILDTSERRLQKSIDEFQQRLQKRFEEQEARAIQREQQRKLKIQEVADESTNEIVAKLREINSMLTHTDASLERLTQTSEPLLEMAMNSRSKQ